MASFRRLGGASAQVLARAKRKMARRLLEAATSPQLVTEGGGNGDLPTDALGAGSGPRARKGKASLRCVVDNCDRPRAERRPFIALRLVGGSHFVALPS